MKGKIKFFQKCIAFRPSVLGMCTHSSEGVIKQEAINNYDASRPIHFNLFSRFVDNGFIDPEISIVHLGNASICIFIIFSCAWGSTFPGCDVTGVSASHHHFVQSHDGMVALETKMLGAKLRSTCN